MKRLFSCLPALLLVLLFSSCARTLTLNDYVIVQPATPTATEKEAAEALQTYFQRISGTQLSILADTAAPVAHEILIGKTNRLTDDSMKRFGLDGFVIRTDGTKLAIYGGERYGTLYGVYSLLEEYFGCRKYTDQAEVVPQTAKLKIKTPIYNQQIPQITTRYSYTMPYDTLYLHWHKLNQDPNGRITDFGLFVHTFDLLLPPDQYFSRHPEYYALVKGQRATTQPCLTNPEVLEIVCQNLAKEIAKNPKAKYWSVSNNDNFGYCTCPACAAIDAEEGSHAGSLIRFINKVAERFPDYTISTLGYHFSRQAPKTKPLPNVNIMFCSIECDRHRPIAEDPNSADFRRDMEDWSKLTDNIFVWDYCGSFKELQMPLPNFKSIQANIQYFVKNNVKIFFEQCSGAMGSEFHPLRGYLVAKLMWNPDLDVNATMNDFLNGYYGPQAGPIIREYIDLLQANMEESGTRFGIFNYTIDFAQSWLSAENLRTYLRIIERAEKAVQNDSILYKRVHYVRQPIQFAQLELSRVDPYGPEGYLQEQDGKFTVKPEWIEKVKDFTASCADNGCTLICEWHSTPEQYLAQMLKIAEIQQEGNLSFRKKVTTQDTISKKFNPQQQGLPLLTDGLYGTELHVCQWLGFYQPTLTFDIDLEAPQTVRHVNASFLQILWESAFMPNRVSVSTSVNGKEFTHAATLNHKLDKDPFYGREQYDLDFPPRQARYVRVRVNAEERCPTWHYYAGDDALIFIDEIVVR